MKNNTTSLLEQVIHHFGGVTKLAAVLGLKHSAVIHWVNTGYVPWLRCYQIELCSEGKFNAMELLKQHGKSIRPNSLQSMIQSAFFLDSSTK